MLYGTKKRGSGGTLFEQHRPLLAETARDVAEDVLDLVAHGNEDKDDDDGDQYEDEGILDHALPFLAVEQVLQAQIQVGQHGVSPPCRRVRYGQSGKRPTAP